VAPVEKLHIHLKKQQYTTDSRVSIRIPYGEYDINTECEYHTYVIAKLTIYKVLFLEKEWWIGKDESYIELTGQIERTIRNNVLALILRDFCKHNQFKGFENVKSKD